MKAFMKTLTLIFYFFTIALYAQDKRPNILYFYVDDMGWGSIGANGQYERKAQNQAYVLTPNLDRLAKAGVNFQRAYGCTVCSPARSSQQTGFHQGYTYADRNNPDNAKKAIRKDDLTMGDVLSKAGYVTGYWGKWGYGGSKDQNNPKIENIQTLPTSHGYQFVVAELHHIRAHTFFQPTLWTAPAKSGSKGGLELKPNSMDAYKNNSKYPNYPAFQNHKDYPKTAYCDDVYAFACLDFVRKQSINYNKTGQPFFGIFAAQIPHAPFDEVSKLPNWNQDYKGKDYFSKLSNQSKQWCAMVTRIDAHFGNILKALEDPNGDGDKSDSVIDDTLIIFQSDNGGPSGNNNSQLDANGGLTGNKGSILEGGIRVPTIMHWPAKINDKSKLKAGTNSQMVIDCTDLLPTFCELAGIKAPLSISGVSIAPTLTGKGMQRKRDFLIHEAGSNVSIIRGNYKLIRTRKGETIKKGRGKKKAISGIHLYDLSKDPAEKVNIAKKHPNLVKELNTLLTTERVDEAMFFANTYHKWLGRSSKLSDASNWSSYVYENSGITYMTEKGAPSASWTARMNSGMKAYADKDIEFLGLEIGGKNSQLLTVPKDVKVTGKNEIRIATNGSLNLEGGTLESMRWVEVNKGGTLKGNGHVNTNLYLQGTLTVNSEGITISEKAVLSGTLMIDPNSEIKAGQIILKAKSIHGKFINDSVSLNGKSFKIQYNQTSVKLIE